MSRVLHIVENLGRGAVENWLVRMLRHSRKRGIAADWTFYCTLGDPGPMDGEARALGARVVHSSAPLRRKSAFMRGLRAEMRRGYDVLHCHHDLMSALYLIASMGLPVRRRIVHVHNADENLPTPSGLKANLFREPMRAVCLMMADKVVGISHHTLDTFLDGRRRRPGRDLVLYYGMDSSPFLAAAGRDEFRRSLGLPPDAIILLFAGRIVPEKNPVFAVDVLAELRRLEPRAAAVFVGSGSQEASVLARARELNIEKTVRMLGWRDGLAGIMGCSDWFILPHPERPMEGFGLAVVEAQLAGLRMLLSQGIADDPILPGAVFSRLALAAGPEAWAKAAVDLMRAPAPSRSAAAEALRKSPMDMDRALDGLLELYP